MKVALHTITSDMVNEDLVDTDPTDAAVPTGVHTDSIGLWADYSDGVSILLTHAERAGTTQSTRQERHIPCQ